MEMSIIKDVVKVKVRRSAYTPFILSEAEALLSYTIQ